MTSSKIVVRSAKDRDLSTLQSVAKSTFIATYEAYNTPENMRFYLETHFSEKAIINQLNDPEVQFFLAEQNEITMGYIKLNMGNAQTEAGYPNTLEIERIYVLSEFHGKGYGKLLLQKAIEVGRNNLVDHVWLGVWDQNPKAIAFYERNGFSTFGTHEFLLGDDPQRDYMMKFDLS
ncbi:MAG: GNAT family N-acetyltransferase [Bacteroidota bacterium]